MLLCGPSRSTAVSQRVAPFALGPSHPVLQGTLPQLPLSLSLFVLRRHPAGKSEHSILHKLQLLSSRVGSLAAKSGVLTGAGASELAAPHKEPGQSPEAPPTPAAALPICQTVQQQQLFPATPQHAPAAVLDRPRTLPNILSRSRKQAPPPKGEGRPRDAGLGH